MAGTEVLLPMFAEIKVEYTRSQSPRDLAVLQLDEFRDRSQPNDYGISLYQSEKRCDYVDRKTYQLTAFLPMLAKRLTGDENWAKDDAADIIYLGAGYWRCRLETDETGELVGARLINPDRTEQEIAIVTMSMNVLL